MGNVPIFTYLHKNTFGVVSEPFKPTVHIANAAGYGVVGVAFLKFGLILLAILAFIICYGFWSGFCEGMRNIEKRKREARDGA